MSDDRPTSTAGTENETDTADSTGLPRRRLLQALGGAAGLATIGLSQNGPIQPARAQSDTSDDWTQQQKLFADDGDENDSFGVAASVSEDGTTAILGASRDEDPNGERAGSAYVFSQSNGQWSQQQKLTADDGDSEDFFGAPVAVSGDGTTVLIGAVGDEDPNGRFAGAVYVFTESGGSWSQQQKLTADDGDREDRFGFSVAVSSDGTTALIGAPFDENPNGENAGSAYVFSQSNGQWSQQQKLTPTDGNTDDVFSGVVSVSGDGTTALLSAGDDLNGPNSGSAYVFTQSNGQWSQQQKLSPDDGDDGDLFGVGLSVSDDGTTAVVGAHVDEDPNGERAGSAYVFSQSNGQWSQQQKLAPDDGDDGDFFAEIVSVSGDGTTAILGASRDEDPNGERAGSAYVFSQSNGQWSQQQKLAPDGGDDSDRFGFLVSVSGDGATALIGAPGDETPNGDRTGSAYVFSRGDQQDPAPGDGSGPQDEPGQIVRVNTAGDVYQVGRLESAPEEFSSGETVQVQIDIEAVINRAKDNIVYGAVGNGDGEVYGLQQMPGAGTGSVTVDASIPAEADGELYWTWVPATNDTDARTRAQNSLSRKQQPPGETSSGKIADLLGIIGQSQASGALALSLELPATAQPGNTITLTAELTNRDIPEPSSGSIELTAVPEPLSLSSASANPVFLGFGNPLPARGESVTQQFEINIPQEAAVEQDRTLEAEAGLENDTDGFDTTATQTVTITDQQDPVQRFDTNDEPGIQRDEVVDAIIESNEGGDVEATDVVDVIIEFNKNSG